MPEVGSITCQECGKPFWRIEPGVVFYEAGRYCQCWMKRCQQWLPIHAPAPPGVTIQLSPLTEADVRRIVREEIAKAKQAEAGGGDA